MNLPPLSHGGMCIMEQGWNLKAKKKDVVRLTVEKDDKEIQMVFRRIDFEQCLFAMAQQDEVLKYIRAEGRAQRNYSES